MLPFALCSDRLFSDKNDQPSICESIEVPHTIMRTKLFSLFFFILSTLISLSIQRDTITPDLQLREGETLISASENFVLGFFSPPGSKNRYLGIWYNRVSLQTVVWVANRRSPVTDSSGLMAIYNGSLVVTGANSTVRWSIAAPRTINPIIAQLLDNGNLVIKDAGNGVFLWQSFDHPTDTLLPGMKLGWNKTSGLNRVLTSWASPSDPSQGNYSSMIDIQGDPQLILSQGSEWIWRGGPWDGVQFSGIPQMKTFLVFNYNFIQTPEEVYYIYQLVNESVISRLMVDYSGKLQRVVWMEQTQSWNLYWFWPKDPCDTVSPCGPFGICNINDSPVCSCLPGFKPRSPEDWALRDSSKGCVRNTDLDCRNKTDGFMTMNKVKLPDTARVTVDGSVGLDECHAKCLKNCSCMAYSSANISDGAAGTGCIMWTTDLTDLRIYPDRGQDLFVRLAAADVALTYKQSYKRKNNITVILIGSISGAAIVILLFSCYRFFLWRRNSSNDRQTNRSVSLPNFSDKHVEEYGIEVPCFDLDTIKKATNNFAPENEIGRGGFGPVYKGYLETRGDVAVKRLSDKSSQGIKEFINEVKVIAKLQHKNLVCLRGYCIEGRERILIYEYMPNGSLDAFLFDSKKCTLLDWQHRHDILQGTARGLVYLHHDSRIQVIHRDMKASNVLLDEELTPKISDFGIARVVNKDDIRDNTTRVIGTIGYMSPEYAMDGILTTKLDVFSFGVLILEVISGRKNKEVCRNKTQFDLIGEVWKLWNEGKALEIIEKSIENTICTEEVLRFINVGLLCVQHDADDRPTMTDVRLMLESFNMSLPKPKAPGIVSQPGVFRIISSSLWRATDPMKRITFTLEGR